MRLLIDVEADGALTRLFQNFIDLNFDAIRLLCVNHTREISKINFELNV